MPAVPVTWRAEQTVNTTTSGVQNAPRLVQTSEGNLHVFWVSDAATGAGSPAGLDIIGRNYDLMGNVLSSEFRGNSGLESSDEASPSLTALVGGDYALAYAGNPGGITSIRLELAAGFFTLADGDASTFLSTPDVAAGSTTSIMTAWRSSDPFSSDIDARTLNPTTGALGSTFTAFAGSTFGGTNTFAAPQILALNNGNYVISATNTTTVGQAAVFKIVTATGVEVLAKTTVGGGFSQQHVDTQLAAFSWGGFAMAWQASIGGETVINVSVFGSAGGALANYTINPAGATTNLREPSLAVLADGRIIITYTNVELGRMEAAHLNYFADTITLLGTQNFATGGAGSEVIALADGRIAVSWINAAGEISLEYLDSRDAPSATPAYTPSQWQMGTIFADTITLALATDFFDGHLGDDIITATGQATVRGGEGNDTIFAAASATGILDGGIGTDTLNTTLFNGNYTINMITGVTNFSGDSFTNFENATTGNGIDTVTGTALRNIISTNGGNDIVHAGDGDDSVTGGAGLDTLNGQVGNDTLDGGADADTLNGGVGNDVYVVTAGDVVTELPGEGLDEVRTTISIYTLTSNVENLRFTDSARHEGGVGNTLDNTIVGNTGVDDLYGREGNDSLYDGGGPATNADTLIGGLGDDNYYVDVRGSSTIELPGEGIDSVFTSFFIFALQANVENLYFNDDANHGGGVGNELDNIIEGGAGVDDLFGRDGNDDLRGSVGAANTLFGQAGDDLYRVANIGDSVIEFADEGYDKVWTSQTQFTLRDHVEELVYTGSATFLGVGGSTANTLFGGDNADALNGMGGTDIIYGGSGADLLQGGTEADQFRYLGGETGLDRIIDFVAGSDRLLLNPAFFTRTPTLNFISTGAPTPTNANSTFMYDVNSGIVSYDPDGTGLVVATQLAQLNVGLSLSLADFGFY